MPHLKKIIVKVLKGDEWKWIHFCYISFDLYNLFFKVTKCEKSGFSAFLSMWAQTDFNLKNTMTTYDDIIALRYAIKRKYENEYPELYALTEEENPRIEGWMRMWVSQHMRVEIAARIGEY